MSIRVIKTVVTGFAISLTLNGGLGAQELPNARDAAKLLFKTGKNRTIVRIVRPDLVPTQYQDALQKAAKLQKFYEAMAASPSEGMLAPSASQAINHNSAVAAQAAAIGACNAKIGKGAAECVIIAEFLPKGYKGPRAFSLSYNASEIFGKTYKRAKKPKAFASSAISGEWGQATNAGSIEAARASALAECTAKAAEKGANDCVVVSEN
jgi:hypothetical protein